MSVLVILEQRGGKWNRMSFETLTAANVIASELKTEVTLPFWAPMCKTLAKEAASMKLRKVYAVTHPLLEQYTPEGMTIALEQLIERLSRKSSCFRIRIKCATMHRSLPRD